MRSGASVDSQEAAGAGVRVAEVVVEAAAEAVEE